MSERTCGPTARPGISLVETMVALLVITAVLTLTTRTVLAFARVQGALSRRTAVFEAGRVVRQVLSRELRTGLPGVDWGVGTGDSVSIRAFRGTGVACDTTPAAPDVAFRYTGLRQVDPAKDSVLLLSPGGVWSAADLTARIPAGTRCGASVTDAEVWRTDPSVPGAVIGRVFERGSYHLQGGAFRYRRGFGGRQPITAQLFATGAAGSRLRGAGLAVEALLAADATGWVATVDSTRLWPLESWP